MNSTESTPAQTGLARFRNSKGFSLIEIAIVLVIIGIIIGAIIKGQDLLVNARTKQLVSTANTWKAASYGYMDRNNILPGDKANKNGIVSDVAGEQGTGNTALDELESSNASLPPNPVIIGGMSFWFFYGNANNDAGNGKVSVIAICKDAACATEFTADEADLISSVDAALDGSVNNGLGAFRSAAKLTTATDFIVAADTAGKRNNGSVTGVTVNKTSAPDTKWTNGSGKDAVAVWAFDRKF